jgi:hypothetical protein
LRHYWEFKNAEIEELLDLKSNSVAWRLQSIGKKLDAMRASADGKTKGSKT